MSGRALKKLYLNMQNGGVWQDKAFAKHRPFAALHPIF